MPSLSAQQTLPGCSGAAVPAGAVGSVGRGEDFSLG